MAASTVYPTGFTSVIGDNLVDFAPLLPSGVSGVSGIRIKNNSGSVINIEYDAASSAGAQDVQPNASFTDDAPTGKTLCRVLHIYTPAPVSIDGTASGDIVVYGLV